MSWRPSASKRRFTALMGTRPHFCPNCKKTVYGRHYVPPSFGEKGYFICEKAKT